MVTALAGRARYLMLTETADPGAAPSTKMLLRFILLSSRLIGCLYPWPPPVARALLPDPRPQSWGRLSGVYEGVFEAAPSVHLAKPHSR